MNIHYLLIGLALVFVVVAALVKPFNFWPVLMLLTLATPARADGTNAASTGTWFTILEGDVKTFFTDNTNLFNQGTVAFEAGPVVNLSNYKFGADFDVQFPVAQQAAIGFDVLYYNGQVYDGTFNTTLGTTWTVPLIGPVYTYAQVGVGTELQDPNTVINEEWAGARTKWQLATGLLGTTDVLSFGINAAAGHVSSETGTMAKLMAAFEYRW